LKEDNRELEAKITSRDKLIDATNEKSRARDMLIDAMIKGGRELVEKIRGHHKEFQKKTEDVLSRADEISSRLEKIERDEEPAKAEL